MHRAASTLAAPPQTTTARRGRRFAGPVAPLGVLCAVLLWPAADAPATPARAVTASADQFGADKAFVLSGAHANAPASAPAFSPDERIASLAAFESAASNLVPADGNGVTDVFAVLRAGPWGKNGTPWRPGRTLLVSRGLGGRPADGPSWGASVGGSMQGASARCVAFVSAASNLVAGDTNGQPDAFLANLRSGALRRVSVGSDGRQADGPTLQVEVDAACRRIAFVADAPNLAVRAAGRTQPKPAVVRAPRRGHPQVYVRVLRAPRGGADRKLVGLTRLVSARGGRPAAAPVGELAFSARGETVAFSTTAPLAGRDANQAKDVFAVDVGSGPPRPRLVSVARSGRSGNGPSGRPSLSAAGQDVAFESEASDLVAGDQDGFSDVFVRRLQSGRTEWCSRPAFGGAQPDGPSHNADITASGAWVLFDSEATNFARTAGALVRLRARRNAWVWFASSRGHVLMSRAADDRPLSVDTVAPKMSARGNYILLPAGDQVLLRYIGPK